MDRALLADRQFVIQAVPLGIGLANAATQLQCDRDVVLGAVRTNGLELQHACASLQADVEVVLEAVRHDGTALQFAAPTLLSERELIEACVQHDQAALRRVPDSVTVDCITALAAVDA